MKGKLSMRNYNDASIQDAGHNLVYLKDRSKKSKPSNLPARANESIRVIRMTRSPEALFNKNYVAWLRKHGARYITMLRNRELGIPIDRYELQALYANLPTSELEVR